jgi:hypothetical protein
MTASRTAVGRRLLASAALMVLLSAALARGLRPIDTGLSRVGATSALLAGAADASMAIYLLT